MQTSTPISNRVDGRRVSFSVPAQLTPLRRRKTPQEENWAVLEETNDEEERAERRRSAALRNSMNKLPSVSDSIQKLDNKGLKTQLQSICQIYNQNKINQQNVWGIRIIDYLQQFVMKERGALLFASVPLEIAGKVYALRVDDLHDGVMKLLLSLKKSCQEKEKQRGANDDDNDALVEDEENQKKANKKQKTKVLKSSIKSDPSEFIEKERKLESVDFNRNFDMELSGLKGLSNMRYLMDPAGCKFMFNSQEKAWSGNSSCDNLLEEMDKEVPFYIGPICSSSICSSFKNIRLDIWDPSDEKENLSKTAIEKDNFQLVLDDDGLPIATLDGSLPDVFQEVDNMDGNEDEPIEESVMARLAGPYANRCGDNIATVDPTYGEKMVTFNSNSLDKIMTVNSICRRVEHIWAGPEHWKLKYIKPKRSMYTGAVEHQEEKPKGEKKRGIKRKSKNVLLTIEDLLCRLEEPTTVQSVKKKNITLDFNKISCPPLDPECEKMIENVEYFMMVPTMKLEKRRSTKDAEYCISDYNYNNQNDSHYCPQVTENDDNQSDLADDLFGDDNRADEDELPIVEAPDMVEQHSMNFTNKAKKMNMKKLKEAMGSALTGKKEFDLAVDIEDGMTFTEAFRRLPKLISNNMKDELSTHLAFVSLLYLCNEHNLRLEQHADLLDFFIFGPQQS